ncbi:MAG: glycosyltransferase, partial [Pseudomonadota bacterium]|nr:glycosyltransferase [Pseudomonadota bacterium]
MLVEEYGRVWHLTRGLADKGHAVEAVCCDYHGESGVDAKRYEGEAGGWINWISYRINPYLPTSWWSYARHLLFVARAFKPDAILAFSDAYQLILGAWLARKLDVPLIADFYDNYESFAASSIPGIRYLLGGAVRSASTVTCVSAPLRDYVALRYRRSGATMVIENGVDSGFLPGVSQADARRCLGLPPDSQIVGTAGALDAGHGIE